MDLAHYDGLDPLILELVYLLKEGITARVNRGFSSPDYIDLQTRIDRTLNELAKLNCCVFVTLERDFNQKSDKTPQTVRKHFVHHTQPSHYMAEITMTFSICKRAETQDVKIENVSIDIDQSRCEDCENLLPEPPPTNENHQTDPPLSEKERAETNKLIEKLGYPFF